MPAWTDLDASIAHAASRVRLLAAVTPVNAVEERRRLISAANAGAPLVPRWQYASPKDDGLARVLKVAAARAPKVLPSALAKVYVARITELDLERRLTLTAGKRELASLARERFGAAAGEALALARRWSREPPSTTDEALVPTDSHHPTSLLSVMRASVSRLGIDFRVVVHPSLASLAATGEHTIYVAADRHTTASVTHRTALHETLAHALPRWRARNQPLGVFSFGTARGQDDQEGYALALEHAHHVMDSTRRRELGARHLAVRAMRQGASFHDVVTTIRELDHGAPAAVVIAERVFRGGTATREGLGREAIYLSAYARVRAAIAKDPSVLDVLGSGQISVRAAPVLKRLTAPGDTRPSRDRRQSV